MARDYKNVTEANLITNKSRTKTKKPSMGTASKTLPIGLWLVSAIIIGGFVSFIVYLKLNVSLETDGSAKTDSLIMKSPRIEKKESTDNKTPKLQPFEFYNILPHREIVLPDISKEEPIEIKKEITVKKPIINRTPRKNGSYIYTLQVGSFLKFKDADRHKANLAMLGIGSRIHAIKTKKITHYRVLVGPYDNIEKINEIDTVMKSNNIKTLLLREKG